MEGQASNNRIAAYVMIYENDAKYLDSFFKNVEMVGVDVGWHLDHCSEATKKKIKEFKRTVFMYEEDTQPYLERFRARPFLALQRMGYDWLFHWDMDERWDVTANLQRDFFKARSLGHKAVKFPMFTAWDGDKLRVDSIFTPNSDGTQTNRERGYDAHCNWAWLDPITVTPYLIVEDKVVPYTDHNAQSVIVHYGNVGQEERLRHKKVWDDNYTRAVSRQPYKFWELVTDETIEVKLADYKDYGLTQQSL